MGQEKKTHFEDTCCVRDHQIIDFNVKKSSDMISQRFRSGTFELYKTVQMASLYLNKEGKISKT
jgi:hypothetical protein